MDKLLQQAMEHWAYVSPLLNAPKSAEDHKALLEVLDKLIDQVGDDENHPLSSLIHAVGTLVFDYEHQNMPMLICDAQGDSEHFKMFSESLHFKESYIDNGGNICEFKHLEFKKDEAGHYCYIIDVDASVCDIHDLNRTAEKLNSYWRIWLSARAVK